MVGVLFVCLCECLSVPFPSLCKKENHDESPRVVYHMLFMRAHRLDMAREAMRARPAQFQRLTMWKNDFKETEDNVCSFVYLHCLVDD